MDRLKRRCCSLHGEQREVSFVEDVPGAYGTSACGRQSRRLVKNLSEKSGERQVYISRQDFIGLLAHLPGWYRPVAQMAYYTGMRRGEIRNSSRQQVNSTAESFSSDRKTPKKGNWKRIPIHRELVPVLEENHEGACNRFRSGVSALMERLCPKGTGRRPWENAVEAVGLDPAPHFHDLRHTWKTNARRSGMDPEIREAIMGHWFREKSSHGAVRADRDQELISAIDHMTFDHGDIGNLRGGSQKRKSPEEGAASTGEKC